MDEYIYNGDVVVMNATIAKNLIAEYKSTVWEAIASYTPISKAVEILSNKLTEHHIINELLPSDDVRLEMLERELEDLKEAIERATKTAYVNKLKREIRYLCKITGDNPDIEADFSDPA
jgi:hypothetical protein